MIFSFFNKGLSFEVTMAILLAYVLVLLLSFTLHEFSHGFAAYLHGDYTAKAMGRLSLNPFVHIDPIGLVSLLVLGFGWAKPVPYNPMNLRDGKRGMFAVAIAGIVANIVLAFVFSFIFVIVLKFAPNVIYGTNFGGILLSFFLQLGIKVNIYLAIFNLIPLFPLDGSKILELILKPGNKFLEFLRKYSLIIMILLLISSALYFVIEFLGGYVEMAFVNLWKIIFRVY